MVSVNFQKLLKVGAHFLACLLMFTFCSLWVALNAGKTAAAQKTTVPLLSGSHLNATVLIYHRFGEGTYPTTNVDVDRFKEQMDYLAANDYHVITLSRLSAALREKQPLPEKSVVITIDDGYLSIYTEAWPILRAHGYPFTVFLYVQALEDGYRNFLTWKQVREIQQAGVDFEDHGYSHHRMADRPAGMDDNAYRIWIRNDLQKSNRVLTEELGHRPPFLAIPYGEYNRIVIEEAKKAKYEAVFSQDPGAVSEATNPFCIPREPILGTDWSTMDHFTKVLNRVDLPLADMTPSIDPLTIETPSRFGARLLHPERYESASLGIYVSELGWRRPKRQGDFVYIENSTPLHRRLNRVMISGREKAGGKTAVRFWLLMR